MPMLTRKHSRPACHCESQFSMPLILHRVVWQSRQAHVGCVPSRRMLYGQLMLKWRACQLVHKCKACLPVMAKPSSPHSSDVTFAPVRSSTFGCCSRRRCRAQRSSSGRDARSTTKAGWANVPAIILVLPNHCMHSMHLQPQCNPWVLGKKVP